MSGYRVGLGFDSHALVSGRRLVLGGVPIDHPEGLLGHSDGDVLAHALIDSLLGAAGLGDIGQHFPDDDPSYAGADSMDLLRRTCALVAGSQLRIGNADATIYANAPRLGPHRDAIRGSLAETLGVDSSRVNLKFKTLEGLGPVDGPGRSGVIAVHVIALLEEAV